MDEQPSSAPRVETGSQFPESRSQPARAGQLPEEPVFDCKTMRYEYKGNLYRFMDDALRDYANDLKSANSALEAKVREMEEHVTAAGMAMERDRSQVCAVLAATRRTLKAREWLRLGRGSYEYDDDRWRDEFSAACDELHEALAPLDKIAADWTHCPRGAVKVQEARANWKQRAESAERELASLRARVDVVERDAEHWKRMYECAQNSNAYRDEALRKEGY